MDDTTDDIFCDLMELPRWQRIQALDQIAGLLPDTRRQIRRQLEDAEKAEDYFTRSSIGDKIVPFSSKLEREGDTCGPYQLVRMIGEGGFGSVWLAHQEKPLKRTVAVKVIKPGMDTAEVLARFERKRKLSHGWTIRT